MKFFKIRKSNICCCRNFTGYRYDIALGCIKFECVFFFIYKWTHIFLFKKVYQCFWEYSVSIECIWAIRSSDWRNCWHSAVSRSSPWSTLSSLQQTTYNQQVKRALFLLLNNKCWFRWFSICKFTLRVCETIWLFEWQSMVRERNRTNMMKRTFWF